MELSMLCGVKAHFVMEDVKTKMLLEYRSDPATNLLVPSREAQNKIKERYFNEDVSVKIGKH